MAISDFLKDHLIGLSKIKRNRTSNIYKSEVKVREILKVKAFERFNFI